VLRHFVLQSTPPHALRDTSIGVFTDDERPLILRGGKAQARPSSENESRNAP